MLNKELVGDALGSNAAGRVFWTIYENIARLQADPVLVWRVTAPDAPEIYEHAQTATQRGFRRSLSTADRGWGVILYLS